MFNDTVLEPNGEMPKAPMGCHEVYESTCSTMRNEESSGKRHIDGRRDLRDAVVVCVTDLMTRPTAAPTSLCLVATKPTLVG